MTKFLSCLYLSEDKVSELSISKKFCTNALNLLRFMRKRCAKVRQKKLETQVALPFLGWYMQAFDEHYRPSILFRCYEDDKIN